MNVFNQGHEGEEEEKFIPGQTGNPNFAGAKKYPSGNKQKERFLKKNEKFRGKFKNEHEIPMKPEKKDNSKVVESNIQQGQFVKDQTAVSYCLDGIRIVNILKDSYTYVTNSQQRRQSQAEAMTAFNELKTASFVHCLVATAQQIIFCEPSNPRLTNVDFNQLLKRQTYTTRYCMEFIHTLGTFSCSLGRCRLTNYTQVAELLLIVADTIRESNDLDDVDDFTLMPFDTMFVDSYLKQIARQVSAWNQQFQVMLPGGQNIQLQIAADNAANLGVQAQWFLDYQELLVDQNNRDNHDTFWNSFELVNNGAQRVYWNGDLPDLQNLWNYVDDTQGLVSNGIGTSNDGAIAFEPRAGGNACQLVKVEDGLHIKVPFALPEVDIQHGHLFRYCKEFKIELTVVQAHSAKREDLESRDVTHSLLL